jgi:hypothetical protein
MSNPEVAITLEDAVGEVLGMLTGLELTYQPELDRFRAITRQLNRALRSNALEHEWSYYADTIDLGPGGEGTTEVILPATWRGRVVGDDSVKLMADDGRIGVWASFLPRESLSKYRGRNGLWVAQTRSTITFSRPLLRDEGLLNVVVPVMREPVMFVLPDQPEDPEEEHTPVPAEILSQEVDFAYPDVVILRAAFYYAQTDPIMQPRVQTIEAQYKDIMYQIIERDDRNTDSPYLNEFFVPVQSGIEPESNPRYHTHPHSDERR